MNKTFIFALFGTLFLVTGCKNSDNTTVTPTPTASALVGQWQMVTSRVVLKATAGGQPATADQTRTGTTADVLTISTGGTISDPKDLFGTRTYAWKYDLTGSELALRAGIVSGSTVIVKPNDVGYFTVTTTSSTMTWRMDKNQAVRSSKDSKNASSVLNGGTDGFDSIQQLDLTIEFKRK